MKRKVMVMADPVFAPGQEKTATVTFEVRPAGLSCTVELWLSRDGVSKDATSGIKAFTSTGAGQSVSLPVVMPVGGYAYQVLLDVFTDSMLISAYEATEQVLVPWVGEPVVEW